MPKCPFCRKEINSVHAYIQELWRYELSLDKRKSLRYKRLGVEDQDEMHAICVCPECESELPFSSWMVGDFLREKYIVLRTDDPEIKRKREYILYRNKVYKIIREGERLLHLRSVENELAADILKANIE